MANSGFDTAPSARVSREMFLLTLSGDTRALGWAFGRAVASLRDVSVAAGDAVFHEGEPSDEHYFVVSGEVKLTRPGAKDWVVKERAVMGSIDMLYERPRTRTATATMPTHLLAMRADEWWALLEDRFELARRVVLNLSTGIHRLRIRPSPLGGFDDPPLSPTTPPSPPSSGSLSLIGRTLLLRTVPLFARASIQTLTALAEVAAELSRAEGDTIFADRPARSQLAVVVSGELSAAHAGDNAVARFGPGSLVLGGSSIAESGDYHVRASTAARVLSVRLDDFFDAMEDHFSLARSAFIALADEQATLLDR